MVKFYSIFLFNMERLMGETVVELEPVVRPKSFLSTKFFLIFGIIFVAFNLRPAITSVGPLIDLIKMDLHISNGVAGFITTLPLLSFGLFSYLAPKFGVRYGNHFIVFCGLLTLFIGLIIRSTGLFSTLLIGTALIGVGIAIGNVLLPSIVKNHFPNNVGLLTGLYTTCMNVFAALGTGLSIPLAKQLNLSWEMSLLFWGIIALLAIFLWTPQLKNHSISKKNKSLEKVTGLNIWKSKIAWQVTLFMGLQSFLFYCTITWLPELLHDYGISIGIAGLMVSIMQICGLPFSFLTPIIADKLKNQIIIVLILGSAYFIGLLLLLLTNDFIFLFIGVILIGMAQGACISLSLTLLSLRAKNSDQASQLSGMAQSVGYAVAAIGPTLIGFLFDLTHDWSLPLITLMVITILMTLVGIGAGKKRFV